MQVNNSNPSKVKVASNSSITNTALLIGMALHNNRMQSDKIAALRLQFCG